MRDTERVRRGVGLGAPPRRGPAAGTLSPVLSRPARAPHSRPVSPGAQAPGRGRHHRGGKCDRRTESGRTGRRTAQQRGAGRRAREHTRSTGPGAKESRPTRGKHTKKETKKTERREQGRTRADAQKRNTPQHTTQSITHLHTGEQAPSGQGHRTRNTTHQACTPVNRSQVAQDVEYTTKNTERADRRTGAKWPRTLHRQQNTPSLHTGEQGPIGQGHRTHSTSPNCSKVVKDTAHATAHTERAHR